MLFRSFTTLLLAIFAVSASAGEKRFEISVEGAITWQERNKVQIPNDESGTRFSLVDIAGNGPWPGARIQFDWHLNDRHSLRALAAPFAYEETGVSDQDLDFAGTRFEAGEPLDAKYQFNSWRIGYRFQYYDKGPWDLWVGATAKIRDAEIRLQQNGVSSQDGNVGFVPLLHLGARYQINDHWYLLGEFDGLAGGPGRAFDVALKAGYRFNDRWEIDFGYRTLEGGADTDDVYNFAWFNSAVAGFRYRF